MLVNRDALEVTSLGSTRVSWIRRHHWPGDFPNNKNYILMTLAIKMG